MVKCMICSRKIEKINEHELKDAFLISFSTCQQFCDNGAAMDDVNNFLCCEKCFSKYGTPLLNKLTLEKK